MWQVDRAGAYAKKPLGQAEVIRDQRGQAFVHECNDYRQAALEGFGWIKSHGNPLNAPISLQFVDKKDMVPLQAADILAYEGNKRLRDLDRPERRAWTALDPDNTRIFAAYYGKENMAGLVQRLDAIRSGDFEAIDLGENAVRHQCLKNLAH